MSTDTSDTTAEDAPDAATFDPDFFVNFGLGEGLVVVLCEKTQNSVGLRTPLKTEGPFRIIVESVEADWYE